MFAGDAKPKQGSLLAQISDVIGQVEQVTECWPEHWLSLNVFGALVTQWNVAYGGYVGLRYEALQPVFEAFGIKNKARAEIFTALRIMEYEALSVINKR